MIVAVEMQGLNDTRPFLLTWNYKDRSYSLDIEKNLYQADLEAGWNVDGHGENFHVTLEPKEGDDDGNGEHRYWRVTITNITGDKPVVLGQGDVSWGEFFLMNA